MPFTPFHMGFGLTTKAVLGVRFSILSFGLTQVLMDLEPGIRMATGQGDLHGWSHTLAGALIVGLFAAASSSRIVRNLIRRWNREVRHYHLPWLAEPSEPARWAVAFGAFLGTFSHLALDALIHRDMHPLMPLVQANPLLGLVEHDRLYTLSAVAACIGAGVWLIRKRLKSNS